MPGFGGRATNLPVKALVSAVDYPAGNPALPAWADVFTPAVSTASVASPAFCTATPSAGYTDSLAIYADGLDSGSTLKLWGQTTSGDGALGTATLRLDSRTSNRGIWQISGQANAKSAYLAWLVTSGGTSLPRLVNGTRADWLQGWTTGTQSVVAGDRVSVHGVNLCKPVASTTSLAVGTGTKVFTVASGLNITTAGNPKVFVKNGLGARSMTGTLTSYSGTTLTMNSTETTGIRSDLTIASANTVSSSTPFTAADVGKSLVISTSTGGWTAGTYTIASTTGAPNYNAVLNTSPGTVGSTGGAWTFFYADWSIYLVDNVMVYLVKSGATSGQTVTPVDLAGPYEVQFIVPVGLATGTWEVWLHNLMGGAAVSGSVMGWSKCGDLMTVVAPGASGGYPGMDWTHHTYSLPHATPSTNGSDFEAALAAIEATIISDGNSGQCTVLLDAGNYDMKRHHIFTANYLIKGVAGTVIRSVAGFSDFYMFDFFDSGGTGFHLGGFDTVTIDTSQGGNWDPTGGAHGFGASIIYYANVLNKVTYNGPNTFGSGTGVAQLGFDFFSSNSPLVMTGCAVTGSYGIRVGFAFLIDGNSFATGGLQRYIGTGPGGSNLQEGVAAVILASFYARSSVTRNTFADVSPSNYGTGRVMWGQSDIGLYNLYIAANKCVLQEPSGLDHNKGEKIVWEGYGNNGADTSITATFASGSFTADLSGFAAAGGGFTAYTGKPYFVYVTSGKGAGQWRIFTPSSFSGSQTYALDHPWDAIPDGTSTLRVAPGIARCTMFNCDWGGVTGQTGLNTAVCLFGTSTTTAWDLVLDGNSGSNLAHGCRFQQGHYNTLNQNNDLSVIEYDQLLTGFPYGFIDRHNSIDGIPGTSVTAAINASMDASFVILIEKGSYTHAYNGVFESPSDTANAGGRIVLLDTTMDGANQGGTAITLNDGTRHVDQLGSTALTNYAH